MKQLQSLIIILLLSSISYAQSTDSSGVLTPSIQKAKTYLNKKQDRIVVNFNFDNWFHQETGGLVTKWYSRGLDIYFMYDMPIKKSAVSFAPGIGFSTSNIYHNSQLRVDSAGVASFVPFSNYTANFKLVKFTTNYIDIPLELRFRTKPMGGDMRFKVGIGFKLGIKIDAYTKERRNDLSADAAYQKTLTKGFKNQVNLFRAGPTLRLGYGPINLNMFLNLISVFKKGKGPDVMPFSAGISINGL